MQSLTCKILLHHVLVQSGHHDGDEHAAQQLLPEVLSAHPIAPLEHAAVAVGGHGSRGLGQRKVQLGGDMQDDESQRREHAERLEGVGPHQRPDAAAACVEPDEGHHAYRRHGKGHAEGLQHVAVQDETHHVETHGGTRHLRQQEERGPRAVAPGAQPTVEPGIDGGEPQPVVQGQKTERHHGVAAHKAEAHLQIGHVGLRHHARHRHESDARDAGAHHAESHQVPGRLPVAAKKGIVVRAPGDEPTVGQQGGKIGENREKNDHPNSLW